MRSTGGLPAPLARRVTGYGANSFALVAVAMRPAAARPLPNSAFPASRMAVGKPDRNMAAARSTVAVAGGRGLGEARSAATFPPSVQAASAGTMSVAIRPGAVRAAMMAAAASRPASDEETEVRNHLEYGRAMPS